MARVKRPGNRKGCESPSTAGSLARPSAAPALFGLGSRPVRPEAPLARQLDWLPPRPEDVRAEDVLDRFLAYVADKGLSLYPAQEQAILEIVAGKNVILSTPTGSGKSLVATAMLFLALAERRRAFYTCPIKALVSEKFFAFCEEFGPEYVGMMTGDATVNRDAPIVV